MNVEERLLLILKNDCEIEDIDNKDLDSPIFSINGNNDHWGIDSLQTLELILAVDREFNIRLDKAPKEVWLSFREITAFIEKNSG